MTNILTSQWLNPPPDNRRFAAACGVSLMLECAALLVLLPIIAHQEAPSDVQSVIKLSIVAPPAAPKPKAPPKVTPVPPKPVTPPPPAAKPLPMPPPPPIPRPAQHVLRHYVKPRIQPPPAATPPVVQTPPTPPPPQAPAAPSAGELDLFRAALKQALQAHADQVYPAAAQMAHETGSPELTFTYLNGVVTNIALAQSAGFPLLDAAALEDARIAQYPPPPAGFAGHAFQVTVSVDFILAAPDVDGD